VLGNLRANRLEETQFIEVFYRDPDPVEAQRVINAMGEVLPDEVQAVSPSTDAVAISLWDEASLPSTPVSPDPIRNGGLGLLLGGVLGVCLAFLLERLDKRRCRSPEQVERVSGAPVYAMIPRFKTPGVPGDDTK
jgi:capsular polysaccharide biosynthesis protein